MREINIHKILLLLVLSFCLPEVSRAAELKRADSASTHAALQNTSALFGSRFFYELKPAAFTTASAQGRVTVQTTLDPDLQQRLNTILSRSGPRIAAAVVLDAKTGAVLAMANRTGPGGASLLPAGADNYCLYGGFPAASLAKIITAAVGLEKGFDTDHRVPVYGRYHTLYRSQLGIERAPYKPELVPLRKAFAMSINPYFGKMWIDSFADREFLDMSNKLLFNRPLEFDLPVVRSRMVPPTDAFERAEVASGYNTRTTISPLHAALIASIPANNGKMMRPYIIDTMTDEQGRIIYRHTKKTLAQPLSSRSVHQLNELMQETVQTGTARGSFGAAKQIAAASGWSMGGKTGSIDLPEHTGRCDWFAGFGTSEKRSLAVACILVHGSYRSMRSSQVAADMIRAGLDPSGLYKLPPVRYAKKTVGKKKPVLLAAKPAKKYPKAAKKKRRTQFQNTGG